MYVRWVVLLLGTSLLSACVIAPTGPSVMALPTVGKPLDLFQAEDASCRQYAQYHTGMAPEEAAAQSTVAGAAIGTAVGAAAGAMIGAGVGNPGTGAAIGAGSGLVLGSASGAQAGAVSAASLQSRYDTAYIQCMYAKGNQVPGVVTTPVSRYSPPPPGLPPPPPGAYSPQPLEPWRR